MAGSAVFVITPTNATPFVMEIQNYRVLYGMGHKLDLTPVARQHVKKGQKQQEVVKFFKGMGFKVSKSQKQLMKEGRRYDAAYVADFSANYLLPFMSNEYRFVLYFKNKKFVKAVGRVHRDIPDGTMVASADEGKRNLK
jgi:hypothetical protein